MTTYHTWRVAWTSAFVLACALAHSARSAEAQPLQGDAMTGVRLELRGASKPTVAGVLEIAVLREGEGLAARRFEVSSEPGAVVALELPFAEALPWTTCRDLEIDIRLGAEGSWSFTIESIRVRTRSGPDRAHVFAYSFESGLEPTEETTAPGPVFALDPSRRGITLHPAPHGCSDPGGPAEENPIPK